MNDRPVSSAAERMRISRQRHRDGLRFVGTEVRNEEIVELVWRGMLAAADQHDGPAIADAVVLLLEETLGEE